MTSWHIDPETLREVVDDLPGLERELESTSAQDRVWMLRVLGRIDEAETLGRQQLATTSDRWRPLLLVADVLRWRGSFDEAAQLQDEALSLAETDSRRATTDQHIGKRLFDEGQNEAAAEHFARSLELRIAIDADSELIASSRLALDRARR